MGTTPWPSFLVGQGDVIHFAACFLVELPRRAGSKFTYNVTKDERTIYKENVEANATGIPGLKEKGKMNNKNITNGQQHVKCSIKQNANDKSLKQTKDK